MRIPFPTRISPFHSCGFAMVLCIAQLLEGTTTEFSLLTFAFIVIATVAFNVAGGFAYPSGSYVFFYAMLAVIIGLVYKAFMGEPADSNLAVPIKTMMVYLAGISGMLVSAYFKKLSLPTKSLLEGTADRVDLEAASLGCIILGAAIFLAGALTLKGGGTADETYANNSGTVLSALSQINQFLPLGIILGVTYQIKKSGGKRFLSTPVAVATLFACLFFGLVYTSKQGLFQPIACVMIAAAALRYKFSVGQAVTFMLGLLFAFYYLVPFIQVGKNVVASDTFAGNVENAYALITDLDAVRKKTLDEALNYSDLDDFSIHYFDSPEGIFDRLQMISIDDALIETTEQGHVFGLTPLLYDTYNLVPHFIWPNKPLIALGNIYSHEIGLAHYSSAGQDDTTTGISFSPSADAFHMARWYGVLLVAPALWFMCFFMMDFVCGDTRKSPWGLLMVAMCAHMAPEGMMNAPFYLTTVGPLMVIFVSFLAAYVLPLIGNVLIKRPTTTIQGTWRGRTATRISSLTNDQLP